MRRGTPEFRSPSSHQLPSGSVSRLGGRSGAGPLSPAGLGLERLRTVELLTRAGVDRVARAAHAAPGGELELEEAEVRVVLLVHR